MNRQISHQSISQKGGREGDNVTAAQLTNRPKLAEVLEVKAN